MMRKLLFLSYALLIMLLISIPIANAEGIDTGDISFVAMASALVMLMTPAVGFFY
ncbi:TPA: ammonium transporter, partial [bacterium]|nr:ammonium transporter [bacterium]